MGERPARHAGRLTPLRRRRAVRCLGLAAGLALGLASCAQVPPERAPLPDVEQVVPQPLSCAFLVGDGRGVLVEGIVSGSPAEGVLAAGDVIVGIDGQSLAVRAELLEELADRRPGDEVTLAIRRAGEDESRGLVLGENPGDASRAFMGVNVLTEYARVAPADINRFVRIQVILGRGAAARQQRQGKKGGKTPAEEGGGRPASG